MKSTLEIIRLLEETKKPFLTIADLEKILGYSRKVLYVLIHRLVAKKVLVKITDGIYRLANRPVKIESVAQVLYLPSYISLESALASHGILNQIPYTISFVTTRKSKHITLEKKDINFSHFKKDLFFGYKRVGDIYQAESEKALIDQLYLVSLGKATLDFEELNLKGLKKTRFLEYAKKYPKSTQKLAKRLVKDFGKTSITIK